jgi:hypothetical protein
MVEDYQVSAGIGQSEHELGIHPEATTGIEPVLSPLRANTGLLRPHMLGSPWLDMSAL